MSAKPETKEITTNETDSEVSCEVPCEVPCEVSCEVSCEVPREVSQEWTDKKTNTSEAPWLDLFVLGYIPKPRGGMVTYKTMEARINKGKWAEMKVGDHLTLKDRNPESRKEARFRIVAKHWAKDFHDLVNQYRRELAPHLSRATDAYDAIVATVPNGKETTEISEGSKEPRGVVALELKLLEYHDFGF